MEMNNLPSNPTNSSPESVNQQPTATEQNSSKLPSKGRPGIVIIGIAVIVLLLIVTVGGYFFVQNKKTDNTSSQATRDETSVEPTKTTQSS